MMQDVPKADVVITNPTHFAVAVKYDANENSAPVVVAKGQDYVAMKIKEIAKENDVEIVENKPAGCGCFFIMWILGRRYRRNYISQLQKYLQ